jgi:hypothetical protein
MKHPYSRRQRRANRDKIKSLRANYWGHGVPLTPRLLGIVADTPKPCSCWLCGNPRHHYNEVTRQEQVAVLRQQDGLIAYHAHN